MYTVSRFSDRLFKHSISYSNFLIKITNISDIEIHLNGYKSLVIRQVFKLKLENLEQIGQFFCNGHGAKSFDFDYRLFLPFTIIGVCASTKVDRMLLLQELFKITRN